MRSVGGMCRIQLNHSLARLKSCWWYGKERLNIKVQTLSHFRINLSQTLVIHTRSLFPQTQKITTNSVNAHITSMSPTIMLWWNCLALAMSSSLVLCCSASCNVDAVSLLARSGWGETKPNQNKWISKNKNEQRNSPQHDILATEDEVMYKMNHEQLMNRQLNSHLCHQPDSCWPLYCCWDSLWTGWSFSTSAACGRLGACWRPVGWVHSSGAAHSRTESAAEREYMWWNTVKEK